MFNSYYDLTGKDLTFVLDHIWIINNSMIDKGLCYGIGLQDIAKSDLKTIPLFVYRLLAIEKQCYKGHQVSAINYYVTTSVPHEASPLHD